MSYISRLGGEFRYTTEESFTRALESIEPWEERIHTEETNGEYVIEFPLGTYRNLGRNLDTAAEEADSGMVIGTSSDVSWHGFIDRADGVTREVDLEEWAEENGEDFNRPYQEEYETTDHWFDAYVDWQTEVEEKWRMEVEE